VHFYHLHALDWVDVVSALKADPKKTAELAQSISPWPNSSFGYFREVQSRLKKFVDSGQLGIFANGYWGSPAYKLPPEANLMATAHYLEALDFQKDIVKIQTIFGGKNPHPNWLVGGVPCSINVHDTGAVGAINMFYLNMVSDIIDRTIAFIDQVYIPDLLAIASFYKDWAQYGGGMASTNLLSYGEFPDKANDHSATEPAAAARRDHRRRPEEIQEVDLKDPDQVQEFVTHSWYKYGHEQPGLHPFDGVTEPNFDPRGNAKGTRTAIENVDEAAKYSWVKSPRWKGHAMEVGPLARWCRLRHGRKVDQGTGGHGPEDPGRADHGALLHPRPHRGARARGLLGRAQDEVLPRPADRQHQGRRLTTANIDKWEPRTWPKPRPGVATCEAPRGALGTG
jgi:hydrogenase large subunit